MDKYRKNIIVLELSKIIYEGLHTSISKLEYDYSFFYVDNLMELEMLIIKKKNSIVLINPTFIQNRVKEFTILKKQHSEVRWLGIIYSFFDDATIKLFDNVFSINEDVKQIIQKIKKIRNKKIAYKQKDEYLTQRENDVLRWLAKGLSNKETADKLNVSIHTINTHRRNIMDKTGIRSLAGLTVYAVSKGIISLN